MRTVSGRMTALILIGLVQGCAPQPTSRPARQASALAARIDSVASQFFALNASPGMGVIVVQGNDVIYRRGFGAANLEENRPFTPRTQFYIASTTKAFTGLTASLLAQRGVWNLDGPLSRYLPGVRLKTPLSPDSISIRSLLTHTHGIANSGPLPVRLAYTGDLRTSSDRLRALELHSAAPSGRNYSYGNIGYNVAAMAMEAVTGASWQQLLERELFRPLGLRRTSAFVSSAAPNNLAMPYVTTPSGFKRLPYGKSDATMQSAGGLISSLDDLGVWLEAHINAGRVDGKQILPAAVFTEAHRNQVTGPVRARSYLPQIGYGLGWQVSVLGPDTVLTHVGVFPGFSTHVSLLPAAQAGLVVTANEGDIGTPQVELLASAIYDLVRQRSMISQDSLKAIAALYDNRRRQISEDVARRAARSQVLPFPRSSYTGSFVNANWGTMVVEEKGGSLTFRMGEARSDAEVYDATKNQLRIDMLGGADIVTVIMDGQRATALEMSSGVRFGRIP